MALLAVAFLTGAALAKDRFAYSTHEIPLPNEAGRAWVYLPENAAGDSLPVVLIGPAGSHLFDGMDLGDSDRPEHIPYAQAGFAVVSFDIPGMLAQGSSDEAVVRAAAQFKSGEGGVTNARAALQLALSQFPRLDRTKIFVAGHSSAATLALVLCSKLENLRGCVAYAPDVNPAASRGDVVKVLEPYLPGEAAFIKSVSPIELVSGIRSPVLIFNAANDDVVPVAAISDYVRAAEAQKVKVDRIEVPSGGHYESMIRQGIPAGIAWMRRELGSTR